MASSLQVLLEDNHLLAVVKPAGLPTMGVSEDRPALIVLAKDYIKRRYAKPGNVYLGIVSRLDAPVSGVVLLARTSKAARRLTEQFRNRSVTKIYWALVEGIVAEPAGQCIDWLIHDERHRRVHVAARDTPGAKEARLKYRRLKTYADSSLLEVALETGRKHQIRVQLQKLGHPIVGDRKYGSVRPFSAGIGLHARSLAFLHPVKHDRIELEAPLPRAWQQFDLPGL
ncbi:MAG: RluA family pseudouridine synthase [Thermoguttaceae bacterium]